MEKNNLTLDDLSDQTGVERRTLRSWVAEGLLPAPLTVGRGAVYPGSSVERVFAVLALRDIHGLPRSAIRSVMMSTDDQGLKTLADEARGLRVRTSESASRSADSDTSARAYLARVRGDTDKEADTAQNFARFLKSVKLPDVSGEISASASQSAQRPQEEFFPEMGFSETVSDFTSAATETAGIEALLTLLESAAKVPQIKRSRGANRYHIPITPDLELSVRGEISPRDRAMLERVADLIRAIITGGLTQDDR
jgi:DNA-binding transcriptional MerR regulator